MSPSSKCEGQQPQGVWQMSGSATSERCLILLELAEKIAMEDPQ